MERCIWTVMLRMLESSTWPHALSKFVDAGVARIRPFDLTLTYNDWTMRKYVCLDRSLDPCSLRLCLQTTSSRPFSLRFLKKKKKPRQDLPLLDTWVSHFAKIRVEEYCVNLRSA